MRVPFRWLRLSAVLAATALVAGLGVAACGKAAAPGAAAGPGPIDVVQVATADANRSGHAPAGPVRVLGPVETTPALADSWMAGWIASDGQVCTDYLVGGRQSSVTCGLPREVGGDFAIAPMTGCDTYSVLGEATAPMASVVIDGGGLSSRAEVVDLKRPTGPAVRLFVISLRVGERLIGQFRLRGYDAAGQLVSTRSLVDDYHNVVRHCG